MLLSAKERLLAGNWDYVALENAFCRPPGNFGFGHDFMELESWFERV